MTKPKIPSMNPEYLRRINMVTDYIDRHIEEPFTLATLADISGFSHYHFSRVFSGVMGETLFGYIRRLRLEKAKSQLAVTDQAITTIAFHFGFNDASDFARAFKRTYGLSATKFRKISKQRQDQITASLYNDKKQAKRSDTTMNLDYRVDVKKIAAMETIYLRHMGSYSDLAKQFKPMMGQLLTYGQQNNLLNEHTKLLAVYHDDPNITEDDNRRTSICLTVPAGTKADADFGQMTLPAGTYAIGHFRLDSGEQMALAWQTLFGVWLPQSGYQPGEGPVFEVYLNDPNAHPQKKHLIDIYLPVKKL